MRPDPLLVRVSGVVMMLSLLFLIVGGDPVVDDFAGTSDAEEKLRVLLASPDAWDRAMMWFAIAAVPIAIGFVLWAIAIHRGGSQPQFTRIATGAAVAAIVGSLAWIVLCYARATGDPVDVASNQDIGWWSSLYEPLVMIAIGLLGFLYRQAGMSRRGWTLMGLSIPSTVIALILPLVVPIFVAAVGLLLVMTRSARWAPTLSTAPSVEL